MISVVVPIYNEEEIIVSLHSEIRLAMNSSGEEWEVVYVNDGSKDNSLSLLRQQQEMDARIVIVELSRNWGHQGALTAGLSAAVGDAIVTMDGDLQDHPCVIPRMIERWRAGAQVVLAERRSRQDRGMKALLYPVFYKVLGILADFPVPTNSGIFGLIDRKVADKINSMPEHNRYIPGLKSFVGFRTETVYYDRMARHAGEPKLTWKKLLRYAFDAIYSFSYKPLRLALLGGITLLLLAITGGSAIVGASFSAAIRGQLWFSYAIALEAFLFFSGLQLLCLGFMGEYIGRIYDEVRQRPIFVVDTVHRAPAATKPYLVPEYSQAPLPETVLTGPEAVNGSQSVVVIPTPAAA